jgi:hypothetical protein
MESLCIAVDPYLPEDCNHFFRPSDKFYFELDLWETEFEDPQETALKIADLRYALERGFDLKKHVIAYMNSLPLVPGYQEPIRSAFRRYIKFMRTGVGKSEHGYKDMTVDILGTEEMIELFCHEVLIYNPKSV